MSNDKDSNEYNKKNKRKRKKKGCNYIFIKGKRKGEKCGKIRYEDQKFCYIHYHKPETLKDNEVKSDEEYDSDADEQGNLDGFIDYEYNEDEFIPNDYNDYNEDEFIPNDYIDYNESEYSEDEYSEDEYNEDEFTLNDYSESEDEFIPDKYSKDNNEDDPQRAHSDESKEEPINAIIIQQPQLLKFMQNQSTRKLSLYERIEMSQIPLEYKTNLLESFNSMEINSKRRQWFESLLKIPFGKYSTPPLDLSKLKIEKRDKKILKYFNKVQKRLNKVVLGMDNVKEEFINWFSQLLNSPNSNSRIIA